MEQYINKSAVAAEIERRIKGLKDCLADTVVGYAGEISGLERLLSFIDTFEAKEVDLIRQLNGFQNFYAHENSGEFPSAIEIAKHFFGLGRSYWQKDNLWKPADGDDLPEIDREVVAIRELKDPTATDCFCGYEIVLAHRPNPDGWDGKSLLTEENEHYTPKTYDAGGWNQPNVKWWLDLDLPKTDE